MVRPQPGERVGALDKESGPRTATVPSCGWEAGRGLLRER